MGNPSRRGKAARSFIDGKRHAGSADAAAGATWTHDHMSNEVKMPNGKEIRL
jgi:hypothetical protein